MLPDSQYHYKEIACRSSLTVFRVEPRTTALSYSWHLFRAKKREKGEVKTTSRKEQTWRKPVINQRVLDLEDH